MKVGDLVVSKAHQKYSNIVPAKLVVQMTKKADRKGPYIVTDDEPSQWKLAKNFFVVSGA
jgi:hypothetical protein